MKAESIIAISTRSNAPAWRDKQGAVSNAVPEKAEAFSINIVSSAAGRSPIVSVTGNDPRGAMFGVGKLLRSIDWQEGRVSIDSDFKVAEAPDRPLRGHQIGYRDTANSWDAWTFDQFDQYFRDFPAPLGPIKATDSPGAIVNSMPHKTSWPGR